MLLSRVSVSLRKWLNVLQLNFDMQTPVVIIYFEPFVGGKRIDISVIAVLVIMSPFPSTTLSTLCLALRNSEWPKDRHEIYLGVSVRLAFCKPSLYRSMWRFWRHPFSQREVWWLRWVLFVYYLRIKLSTTKAPVFKFIQTYLAASNVSYPGLTLLGPGN
jgi:hypothetical protein